MPYFSGMKKAPWICYFAIILFLATGCNQRSGKPRLLVFTKAAGYHHDSIPIGVQAILTLGSQHNFEVDTTSDTGHFGEDSLRKYSAVIFLNTSGTLLDHYHRADFERYIQAGGGYVGLHAAPAAKYDWGWYSRLIGGADSTGRHEFDGGRAWYTPSGDSDASYADSAWARQLLEGIEYAIGDNKNLDYSRATSLRAPEEDRFTKTPVMMGEFFEPTEMTILPNLDILVLQRRGEIMLYKQSTNTVKQVGFLNVYSVSKIKNLNVEEGMLGLSKDPDFKDNHWVYIYYSPADSSVNRLSRFSLENDTIINSSEKVILEVKSQREICCHTGGSIAFGPDSLLYFSAGDNSTPFDEPGQAYVNHGFAPLNYAPGHLQFDAERSAGNARAHQAGDRRSIGAGNTAYRRSRLCLRGNPRSVFAGSYLMPATR